MSGVIDVWRAHCAGDPLTEATRIHIETVLVCFRNLVGFLDGRDGDHMYQQDREDTAVTIKRIEGKLWGLVEQAKRVATLEQRCSELADWRDGALRLASTYQSEMHAAFGERDAAKARVFAAESERDSLREIHARRVAWEATRGVDVIGMPIPTEQPVHVPLSTDQARYLAEHLEATCCGLSSGFRRDLFHEAIRLIRIALRRAQPEPRPEAIPSGRAPSVKAAATVLLIATLAEEVKRARARFDEDRKTAAELGHGLSEGTIEKHLTTIRGAERRFADEVIRVLESTTGVIDATEAPKGDLGRNLEFDPIRSKP